MGIFVNDNSKKEDTLIKWKENALVNPTPGKMIGAGNIDITIANLEDIYENSGKYGKVNEYNIYIDGEKQFAKMCIRDRGNPKGYETYKLTDADKYVYEEPTTQQPTTTATPKVEETTTQVTTTTVVPVETTKATTIGKVKIKSAKVTKKKSVKVTWKKAAGTKKYQVQYSLNKKFKKSKTKKTGKLSIVLSKLAGGKKYFVRVRGINGSDKGPWSKTCLLYTSRCV